MVQPGGPAGSGAGGAPTRSASAHDDEYDPYDRPRERVIPIRGGRRREQARRATPAETEGESSQSAARRGSARHRDGGNNAMQQAVLTVGAFVVAVVVLAFVLSRVLATGGERVATAPTPRADSTALVAADLPAESTSADPEGGAAVDEESPAAEQPVAEATKAISFESKVLEPNYTVEPGDTLGTIAERSGNTIDALVGLNNLPDRDGLSVGQTLIVPES